MLMRRLIAWNNLKKTQPPIDEDQKLALLHAPFTGTTLFGGELVRLQEANTKRASTITVFPMPAPLSPTPLGRMLGKGEVINIQIGEGATLEGLRKNTVAVSFFQNCAMQR